MKTFQRGLRDLGYLEGKNIVLEYRDAQGKAERFPGLAAELVRSKVDIIVAVNEVGARAAKNATQTIPIVMVSVGTNPVEVGLAESFARPGGNITGLTNMAVELTGKRLEGEFRNSFFQQLAWTHFTIGPFAGMYRRQKMFRKPDPLWS